MVGIETTAPADHLGGRAAGQQRSRNAVYERMSESSDELNSRTSQRTVSSASKRIGDRILLRESA